MTDERVSELYKLAKSFCIKQHILFDDDLIQELVIFVYEKYGKYDENRGHFSTFAYMCFRNYLYDKYRKSNNAEILVNNEDFAFIDRYTDPIQKIIIDEVLRVISDDEVMLDWLAGLSMEEIAIKYSKHRTTISRYINKKIEELKNTYVGG